MNHDPHPTPTPKVATSPTVCLVDTENSCVAKKKEHKGHVKIELQQATSSVTLWKQELVSRG